MKKSPRTIFGELSIQDVVRLSGYPYPTVWRHASGKRNVSPEAALRYERTLGIPRSELRPDLWPPEDGTSSSPAPAKEAV